MKLRYVRKGDEGHGIWSFYFEPAEDMTWRAGQSIRLELPRPTWGIDERRFTIASAPQEKHMQITTRLSDSSFKRSLAALTPGTEVQGHNIEGDFVWEATDKPRLFIAGGIGITPFRAMIAQAVSDGTPLNTTLIYSAKETTPLFKRELDAWQARDSTFFVHYLVSTRLMLPKQASLATYWLENQVYISGPEAMVQDIRQTLLAQGMPEGQIRCDLFTGY
jgi:ferredoxin-NADP reductase